MPGPATVSLHRERGGAISGDLVDFHNHVLPGVDDGARDVEEALQAVAALHREGVGTVVATPHLPASHTEHAGVLLERLERLDGAYEALDGRLERDGRGVRLERGAEVRLNAPEPDLSDPRLRLAGTHFVLVEFSAFQMPPYGMEQLAQIRRQGWIPVLAHPERYVGVARALHTVEGWREHAFFQLNTGSLLGEYGPEPRRAARSLLARGWVEYVSSDYHARGEPGIAAALALLNQGTISTAAGVDEAGSGASATGPRATGPTETGAEVASLVRLLAEVNPARLLENREPLPVPPLKLGTGVWDRVRRLFG